MSGSTFRELLAKPTDEVERPRPLASGHYIGEIKSHEFGMSKQKQTPFVRFIFSPSEETSDVVEDANVGLELEKQEVRRDFYITPSALYRLTDFLDAVLGKTSGRSFDERIPETRGVRVLMHITTRDVLDTDGNIANTYNDVGNVVAA